jgi:hypothetical protein
MADPEGSEPGSEPDKAWERYEEADSEDGPLGAIAGIPKVATEAFLAETLKEFGELVGHVVVEWAGTQVVNKALEAVETDREPSSPSAPSPPVDMGVPAMGVPAEPDQEDAASPPWDPSGTQGPSNEQEEDDATAAAAAPSDQEDPPSPPAAALPDLNIGSPTWDPSANASGFAGPPEMPPIPLAPDPTE